MQDTEIDHVKKAVAALTSCLVQAMAKAEPEFQNRFLERLGEAYSEFRDNTDGDVRHELETLSWTRSMITGFNFVDGQGDTFPPTY
jgi:hypothetical protein